MSVDDRQWKEFDQDQIDRGCIEVYYKADVTRLNTSEVNRLMNKARELEKRLKAIFGVQNPTVVSTVAEVNPSQRELVVLDESVSIDTDEPLEVGHDIPRSRLYQIRDGIEAEFHYLYLRLLQNHQ